MLRLFPAVLVAFVVLGAEEAVETWPQFRGPAGSAVGDDTSSFPSEFGPKKSLVWRTDLPLGHGSPSIWGDRVFVTAFDPGENKLEVIAIDRRDGRIVWRHAVETAEIEKVHKISSPANSTPPTDGERVYVYFGSVGLLALDWNGNLVWKHALDVAKSPFGSGSSPVIAGDLVLINRDYPPDPYLLAVGRSDGKLVWRVGLEPGTGPGPKTSHATPFIWKEQVLLHRPGTLSAYSLEDGRRLWWVQSGGTGTSTPAGSDEGVYVAAFGVRAARLMDPIPFSEALAKYDGDKDGKLSRDECPEFDLYFLKRPGVPDTVPGAHFSIRSFFRLVDGDKDGLVDEAEYLGIYETFKNMPATDSGLTAIRPNGEGNLSLEAVKWAEPRAVPEVPSPLAYRRRVYAVASGGIITCVEEATGKVLFRGRVNAPGAYYASPVAAGGRLIIASSEGVISVLGGGDTLEVLSNNDIGEPIFGTPAPMKNTLYVRSLNYLWAFGSRTTAQPAR